MIVDYSARVSERAYEIWEEEGRPEGRSEAHWYRAEQEIARTGTPRRSRRARLNLAPAAATSVVAPQQKPAVIATRVRRSRSSGRNIRSYTGGA